MNSLIDFLMDASDEVQDVLAVYRTDPTEENKRRLLETILAETESGRALLDAAPPAVVKKLPHDYVLVPNVDSLRALRAVTAGRDVVLTSGPDDDLLSVAKQAASLARHVHELGGSAVYVRFTSSEWLAAFDDIGVSRILRRFSELLSETDSLDAIATQTESLICSVGNMTDREYAASLISDMYAVAKNEHDVESTSKALIAMIDRTLTQNLPSDL